MADDLSSFGEEVVDLSSQGDPVEDLSSFGQPADDVILTAPIKSARTPEELAIQNLQARQEFIDKGWITPKSDSMTPWENMTAPFITLVDKLGLNAQTIKDAMSAMNQYAARASGEVSNEEVQAALAEPSEPPGTPEKVAAGAQKAVIGSLEFFTSPLGIMTLGATGLPQALQRGVAGAFVVDMARKAPAQVAEVAEAAYSDDPERLSHAIAGLGLTTAFIKVAGTHALKGEAAATVQPAETKPRVMPRLEPYEAEKAVATAPQGMSKIPLVGRIMDPRTVAKEPADRAIIANAYSRAKGDTFGAVWGEQATTRYRFKADESGTIELADGSRGHLSDVIEAEMRRPGSQRLTQEQRTFVDEWRTIHRESLDILKEEKVKGFEVDEAGEFLNINDKAYFPRIAVGVRGSEAGPATSGARVGGKQFYQKQRDYRTEREGAERIIYEPDPIKRVATFISKVYKAVADTRLANDPALSGRTGQPRFGAEGTVQQPAFQGKAFPKETAERLNEFYGDKTPMWLRKVNNISQASKALTFTADVSAPLNQGLVIAFSNPAIWGKATAKSLGSLARPQVLSKYLNDNAGLVSEFVQSGGTVRRMQDFLAGTEKGQFATKIPIIGPIIARTGRAFETFLDVAKLELWKSYRDVLPKEKWPEAVEAIENMVLSGRMEQIGLSPSRAMAERVAFNAPSYYRAGFNLIASALHNGVSGKIARGALIKFLGGVTLLHYGIYRMLGLDDTEIAKRLNPSSGKFLKVPMRLATGEAIEVGFSNFILRLMRLAGDTVEEATDDKPVGYGMDNPWVRFARSMAGPAPGLLSDVAQGEDPAGRPTGIARAVANRFMPITAQPLTQADASLKENLVDAAFSFFGLNSFQQSRREMFFAERDRVSKATYGRNYENLGINKQLQITRRLQRDPRFARQPSTPKQVQFALQADAERRERVAKSISEPNQKKLAELGLSVTGYRPVIAIGGQELPLTPKQQERYEKLIVDGYDKLIAKLPLTLTNMPLDKRQDFFVGALSSVKRTATAQFIRENR